MKAQLNKYGLLLIVLLFSTSQLLAQSNKKLENEAQKNFIIEQFIEQIAENSEDEKGIVMGLSHKTHDVRGLQFHPESILTENGIQLMKNWLEKV